MKATLFALAMLASSPAFADACSGADYVDCLDMEMQQAEQREAIEEMREELDELREDLEELQEYEEEE